MKKFLAVLLTLFILVLFPIVLISTLTRYQLLTAPTIKHIIRSSEVGENLPNIALAYVKSEEASLPIDEGALTELAATAFTPNMIYALTDSIVDTVGSWWSTDKPIEQLNLLIDLRPAKQQLAPALDEYFNKLMQNLPPCNLTVLTDEFNPLSSDCALPDLPLKDMVLENIPETINVQDVLQQQIVPNGDSAQLVLLNQQINQFRLYWKWLQWAIWIGWGVIGLFLLFIVLLRLHPGFSPFNWLGWLHLLMTIEVAPIVVVVWLAPQFVLPWISGTFDVTIISVINKALTALLAIYLWPLIWVLIGTFVGSVIWFIIRGIVKHHIIHTSAQSTVPAKKVEQPKTEKSEL